MIPSAPLTPADGAGAAGALEAAGAIDVAGAHAAGSGERARSGLSAQLADYVDLTKPRITGKVLVTTFLG